MAYVSAAHCCLPPATQQVIIIVLSARWLCVSCVCINATATAIQYDSILGSTRAVRCGEWLQHRETTAHERKKQKKSHHHRYGSRFCVFVGQDHFDAHMQTHAPVHRADVPPVYSIVCYTQTAFTISILAVAEAIEIYTRHNTAAAATVYISRGQSGVSARAERKRIWWDGRLPHQSNRRCRVELLWKWICAVRCVKNTEQNARTLCTRSQQSRERFFSSTRRYIFCVCDACKW